MRARILGVDVIRLLEKTQLDSEFNTRQKTAASSTDSSLVPAVVFKSPIEIVDGTRDTQ